MKAHGEAANLLNDRDDISPGKLSLNWLSNWTYWWIARTIWKGFHRPLKSTDIYDIVPEYSAEENVKCLKSSTNNRIGGARIYLRLMQPCSLDSMYLWGSCLMLHGLGLCQPILLGLYLDYINYDVMSDRLGYTYALFLVLSCIGHVLFNMHTYYMTDILGMRIRTAYCSAIYNKILKMRASQREKTTVGTIITLVSTDVELVCKDMYIGFVGGSGVVCTVGLVVLLYVDLGWISLVGLASCSVIAIVSVACSTKYAVMRLTIAKATDYRVQMMNEIINAIRVIKMYCWERTFQDTIQNARKEETHKIMVSNIYKGLAMGLSKSASPATAAAMLLTYAAVGHTLTVSTVFRTLLYCDFLQYFVVYSFPRSIQEMGQMFTSLERIEEFLSVKDTHSKDTGHADVETAEGDTVDLKDVSASWDDSANNKDKVYPIRNLTFSCQRGELVAVIGPVGAGKTSLLMHLADEMPVSSGHLGKPTRISYSPQDPWIFHDTVRQNILFGEAMDTVRYNEVVSACGLSKDVSQMPQGDMTLVGEKGLTLSGGQKARVSLARAVYRDADLYLLDDPLSALDTLVGEHVLKRCILGFLADKTRILVTHQTQYLSNADSIIVLHQGTTAFVGNPAEMSDSEDQLASCNDMQSKDVRYDSLEVMEDKCTVIKAPLPAEVLDESKKGEVGWSVYVTFLRAGGFLLFVACIGLFVLTKAIAMSADWYLSKWTGRAQDCADSTDATLLSNSTDPSVLCENEERLKQMYIGLSSLAFCMCAIANVPLFIALSVAARNVHDSMFGSVMRAPTRFFDTNPIGIVLNRFSRDLGFVDLQLPQFVVQFVNYFMKSISGIVMVCLVLPWMLIMVFVLTAILCAVYHVCLSAFRDLKRLEASGRSPVYSHISETLTGLQSIRILKRTTDFQTRFYAYQDEHTMRWLMFQTAFQWLALVASLVVIIFLIVVVVLSVLLKDDVSAALLGLILKYTVAMVYNFECQFRTAALIESSMTSVERILNYSSLDQEAEPINKLRPPDNWPQSGNIQLRNVSLFYYEGAPAALKDINVNIHPEQKVGIVGRTGSGKSSLLHSLMRLTEPCGQVFIDGVDVKTIGLQDLRGRISVIPQDPVLFSGTLRQNLDPTSSVSDGELWNVLRKVQLADKVQRMVGELDAEIYGGGANLSTGEKQLVCLARALLKNNKILILDEATANVDKNTDQVIQATIRLYFHHCTVLIIAHRLNTIMDCHRVMVLDHGELVEYDVPYLLLQNPDGQFYNYVHQSTSTSDLLEIAREAYINRLAIHHNS